jgi:transcriptional regulator with XRE-family HTH domain
MIDPRPYPNRFAEERTAAGFATPSELATRAGIEPAWYAHIEAGEILPTLEQLDRLVAALGEIDRKKLYVFGLLNTIGGTQPPDHPPDYAKFYGARVEIEHMLVSRDEVRWLERDVAPDRAVDVFVNMSCGTQEVPHLLMNTMSVFETLGVSFAAAAGRITCCGTYYRGNRQTDAADRMHEASLGRAIAWGAKETVHWCTQCENAYGAVARRRELAGGDEPYLKNTQLLTFLDRRVREMGDTVPWRKRGAARVLVQGSEYSPVHAHAKQMAASLLAQIPGVEVVGFVDLPDATREMPGGGPKTQDEVRAKREELAELARTRGADTISPQHHNGQKLWSRYSSATVAVRHPISILAEALGCEQPDRYQAALQLGAPDDVVAQLRPVWQSWGVSEEKAAALAREMFDPMYAAGPSKCACGGGGNCREALIDVDVLAGAVARR